MTGYNTKSRYSSLQNAYVKETYGIKIIFRKEKEGGLKKCSSDHECLISISEQDLSGFSIMLKVMARSSLSTEEESGVMCPQCNIY